MNTVRITALALAGVLGLGIASASADDDDWGWMPHHYGHMGMMGPGSGWGMGHGPGWMMGSGHGWMMGPGHGWMGYGPGPMMGHGQGWMKGYGHGRRWGGAGMDPDRLDDETLDRIGERIAERHRAMQQIAEEQDPAARRELVREHLKNRRGRWGKSWDDDDDDVSRRGYGRGRMMGPGMMGRGMMGPGFSGPGAMMGPGMMNRGGISDEYLDRMAERMAENYQRMQQLAQTTDKAERRKLLREHFESMNLYRGGMY